ncbi:hypothetical protein ACNVED_00550 [Legionella sp. D16C41]|uniref:hypothetical protein n=1 Tax=Legionella sp. D16C41 TaxID=3402688 RepID=UPI003AF90F10
MRILIGIFLLLANTFVLALDSSFLFLQHANKGELIKNKDSSYSLTLREVPAYVSYFTDKPKRKAGILPLVQFITLLADKDLKNHFSAISPNAAIAMIANSGQQQNFTALLSKPHYIENGTIIYQLKMVSKNPILTGNMKHINMFINDVHWDPTRIIS